MDLSPDGAHVRLQSRELGTYLYADEDGVGVSLSRRRASLNAAWQVHRVMHDGVAYVLLHGAAYGRYLAVSPDVVQQRGHRGRRVVQSDRDDDLDHPRAVMWRSIRSGDGGDDVIVRHDQHRNLRANGRYLRWHTGVTVDDSLARWSTMMHWRVQAIPPRAARPEIPQVATPNVGTRRSLFRRRVAPANPSQRMIWYVVADDDGNVDDHNWNNFMFPGRSVFSLMVHVAMRQGHVDANHFVLCVQAGHDARRTPLVIGLLPPQVHPLHIIVLVNGSPGAAALVYPDVDAEAPNADAEGP